MIIYGSKGAHVATVALPAVACPNCATLVGLQLSVFSRYAHIYWIPLFPFGKPIVLQCNHCQQVWEENALPPQIREPVLAIKKQTRAPFWHWSGLALLAVGLGGSVVASSRNDKANATHLAAPRPGDIYTVRSEEDKSNYSLLKVVSAKGNSVELVANEFEINNAHPLKDLDKPEKYSKEPFSMTQFELQIMKNKGRITDVDRPGE